MRRKLFQVEDCLYTVSGKLVLATKTEKASIIFKEGNFVILVKPDGTEIKTQISGAGKHKVNNSLVYTVLLDNLKKEDIPTGTIVFLDN